MLITLLLATAIVSFTLLIVAIMSLVSVVGGAQLVTTPQAIWPLTVELARLKADERFLELGSGIGHMAAYVADHSQAIVAGIDLAPLWVILARFHHRRSRATFQIGSVYAADLRTADVVYCYLLPPMLVKLEPKFAAELKPGSRVITYGFPLPSRQPSRTNERTATHGPLYLYQF